MTEYDPSLPLLQLPLNLHIKNGEGQSIAVVSHRDHLQIIILSTKELLDISKTVRGGVIEILGFHIVVEDHRTTHSLTIICSGAPTLLRMGIPGEGLADQKIHFTTEGIFFDRGRDTVPGTPLTMLYPFSDQSGAFPGQNL